MPANRQALESLPLSLSSLLSMLPACRDVKLENALLDSTHTLLKITDFGYAKTSADSNCLSLVGTPGYAGMLLLGAAHVEPLWCLSTL